MCWNRMEHKQVPLRLCRWHKFQKLFEDIQTTDRKIWHMILCNIRGKYCRHYGSYSVNAKYIVYTWYCVWFQVAKEYIHISSAQRTFWHAIVPNTHARRLGWLRKVRWVRLQLWAGWWIWLPRLLRYASKAEKVWKNTPSTLVVVSHQQGAHKTSKAWTVINCFGIKSLHPSFNSNSHWHEYSDNISGALQTQIVVTCPLRMKTMTKHGNAWWLLTPPVLLGHPPWKDVLWWKNMEDVGKGSRLSNCISWVCMLPCSHHAIARPDRFMRWKLKNLYAVK